MLYHVLYTWNLRNVFATVERFIQRGGAFVNSSNLYYETNPYAVMGGGGG